MKNCIRPITALLCLLLTVCPAIAADDEGAGALGAELLEAMMTADAGEAAPTGYVVSNLWLEDGKPLSEDALWRHFMHGVTDEKATVIAWDSLLTDKPSQDIWFSPDDLLDCELKAANLPTVRLRAGQSLTFRQPVLAPESLEPLKGKTLRFFIWLKGEACGQGVSLWDGAPVATFILKDALGNQTAVYASPFKTRGTFPWHCYNTTVAIPGDINTGSGKTAAAGADAESGEAIASLLISSLDDFGDDSLPSAPGLYLSLKNPVSGTACFTALSWEVLPDETNDYEPPKADPATGSLAPNPDYDEYPMHFFFGLAGNQPWNFLRGNDLNLNLTTIDGLRQYVNANKDDWFAFQHVIAALAAAYGTGEALKLLPPMEDGWLDTLRGLVLSLQDEKTGLWLVNGKPSILATASVVANGFTAKTLPRQDLAASDTPWACRLGAEIPHAALLAKSLLNARTGAGQAKVYWNRFAFHEDAAENSDFLTDIDLGSTAAAIQLLQAIAATSDDDALKAEISQAADQAVAFVMQNLLQDNGLWLTSNRTVHPDNAAFLPTLLDASAWAESRPWADAPAQNLNAAVQPDGSLFFTWQAKNDACVAVRLYAAPVDAVPETIGDNQLLGVINRHGARLTGLDPLVALGLIENAMRQRWNCGYYEAGARYLQWKKGQLGGRLICSFENENLSIPKARIARIRRNEAYASGVKFYGAAVSQTGRRSALVPLCEIKD